jgi:tetratricopeptide (TPR) repeat protein
MLDSWLLVAKGEVDAAVERLAALGENDGFGALYRLQLALLYDVAGRSDAAEAEYRAALQAAGQPSLRLTWLAGNYFERQGQAEAADQTYMAFLGSEPANTFFDQALRRVADGVRPLPSVPDHKAGMAEVL